MKKEYTKPILYTKAYAQFENVFTACDKTKGSMANATKPCTPDSVPSENYDPATTSHYNDIRSK